MLLQYLKHPRVLKLVSDNFVSGSALPRIVLKDFKKLMLLVPERSIQEEILPALRSIPGLIHINEEESERLRSLRDLLLPKLMSNEIDVSKIELPTLPNNHLYLCKMHKSDKPICYSDRRKVRKIYLYVRRVSAMAIPKYDELYEAVLRFLSDGREHSAKEMRAAIIEELDLTVSERNELLPSTTSANN